MGALAGVGVGGAVGGLVERWSAWAFPSTKPSATRGGSRLAACCCRYTATSDEITRAKDVLKRTGAEDVSSAGEEAVGAASHDSNRYEQTARSLTGGCVLRLLSKHGVDMADSTADTLPTILLVEDDPDMRRYMVTWLEAEGYCVRQASNGREALDVLADEVPCVMVVDLMMPVMDGAEFRRRQQQIPSVSSVPFIMVSGTHDAPRIARDLGIENVMAKPFDAEQLLDIVASHCHHRPRRPAP